MRAETMPFGIAFDDIPDDENFIDEMIGLVEGAGLSGLYKPLPEKKQWLLGKKAWRMVSSVFFYSALALAILAALVFTGDPGDVRNLMGYSYFTVMTPSMRSSLPVGSLIITRRTDANLLQVGDAITYFAANNTVTHRIVDVTHGVDGLEFQTKGDDNTFVDPDPVSADRVIGRVVFRVRYVGHVMLFIQQRIAWVLGMFFILILLSFALQQFLRKDEAEKEDEKKRKGRM